MAAASKRAAGTPGTAVRHRPHEVLVMIFRLAESAFVPPKPTKPPVGLFKAIRSPPLDIIATSALVDHDASNTSSTPAPVAGSMPPAKRLAEDPCAFSAYGHSPSTG